MSREQLKSWPDFYTTWYKFRTKDDKLSGEEDFVSNNTATARRLIGFHLTPLGRAGHGGFAYVWTMLFFNVGKIGYADAVDPHQLTDAPHKWTDTDNDEVRHGVPPLFTPATNYMCNEVRELLQGADVLRHLHADVYAVVHLERKWVVHDVEAASNSVPGAGGV
eukprot:jgi/Tetstr1/432976/TSEL_022313.t1